MTPESIRGRRLHRRRFTIATILLSAIVAVGGCTPDLAPSPVQDQASVLWTLTLNHRAVLLSLSQPYDTVQLVATPRNVDGVALVNTPSVTFTTLDTTIRLSETGLVRASSVTPSAGARVIARISSGQITQADTVFIHIRNTGTLPGSLRSFELYRIDADSSHAAIGLQYLPAIADTSGTRFGDFGNVVPALSVRVIGASGDTLRVPAYYTSSDNTIATIDRSSGIVTSLQPGDLTFTATAYVYGAMVRDTIQFRIGPPIIQMINICTPGCTSRVAIRIGVGGAVQWQNNLSDQSPLDVVFENPSAVSGVVANGQTVFTSGNITALKYPLRTWRIFRTPGVYPFRTTTQPAISGSVTVIDE